MKNVTNSVLKGCRKGALVAGAIFCVLSPAEPEVQVLESMRKIPHSGYSEGLDYHQDFLWHALPKKILKINPKDGSVLQEFKPATEYSESIKWAFRKIWNLSFSDNGLYSASLSLGSFKFEKMATLPEAHGWGIEQVGKELVVTGNFSSKLYFFNPKAKKWTRTLQTQAKDIEDLAFDGKRLWASSFTEDRGRIFSIDLVSGQITEKWELQEQENCPIIDGIAFDGKSLWITGKECPSIYQVKLPPLQRNVSSQKKLSP
jgi:glutamine cyclotransferase